MSIINEKNAVELEAYVPFKRLKEIGDTVEGVVLAIEEEDKRLDPKTEVVYGPQRVFTIKTEEGVILNFGVPHKWKSVIKALDTKNASVGDTVAFKLKDKLPTEHYNERFDIELYVAKA